MTCSLQIRPKANQSPFVLLLIYGITSVSNGAHHQTIGNQDTIHLGIAVSVYNNTAAMVSCSDYYCNGKKELYMYHKNLETTKWQKAQILNISSASVKQSIAFNTEKQLIIGADYNPFSVPYGTLITDAHIAYIFDNLDGNWINTARLLISNQYPEKGPSGRCGWDVAMYHEHAMVTCLSGADIVYKAGIAYVFEYINETWIQTQQLTSAHPQTNNEFGRSIAIYNHTAVIGATGVDNSKGAAYIYTYNKHNGGWRQMQQLVATDGNEWDQFGYAVAIVRDHVVITAKSNYHYGAVYIFNQMGSSWVATQIIRPRNLHHPGFGASVDVFDDVMVVSYDVYRKKSSFYVFKYNGTIWIQTEELKPHNNVSSYADDDVSVWDNTIVIGMQHDNLFAPSGGSVHIYERNDHNAAWLPTANPTDIPTSDPSMIPTKYPSLVPSTDPSFGPSDVPSVGPSNDPSINPSADPTTTPVATFTSYNNNTDVSIMPSSAKSYDAIFTNKHSTLMIVGVACAVIVGILLFMVVVVVWFRRYQRNKHMKTELRLIQISLT